MDGVCKIQLLSTKRAVFMDKDYKSRDLSTKRAIFMDSKRLCTTRNLQIAGVLPGIKCIFTGKLLSVPSFFGVSRAVSLCICDWSIVT